jgi:hypothetical protein
MGRNKELRKKIAALRAVAEKHGEKVRLEQTKPMPNESYIRCWTREINTATEKIEQLVRRLRREW